MPIDRHNSGDDFDRNDDVRANEPGQQDTGQQDAGQKKVETNQTKAKRGATTDAVKRKTKSASKTKPAKAKAGQAKAGQAKAGQAKAGQAKAGQAKAGKTVAKKSASQRTARNRAGNIAQSKQTVMKEMAQKALLENAVLEQARAKKQGEKTSSKKGDSKTPDAKKVEQLAGNGIIWSLLAMGLAACGGGTNTVLKEVKVSDGAGTADTPDTTGTPDTPGTTGTPDTPGTTGTTGGGGDDVVVGAASFDIVRVIDGPIKGATVYGIDKDGNRIKLSKKTNEKGEVELTEDERGKFERFEANLNGATDVATGETYKNDVIMKSVVGLNLLTPLTTIIQQAIEDAEDDDDEDTTAETAQQKVIHVLFGEKSGITMEHIKEHSNYRVTSSTDAFSKTSNMIGKMGIRILETVRQKYLELKKANDDDATLAANKKSDDQLYQQAVETVTERVVAAPIKGNSNAGAVTGIFKDKTGILAENDPRVVPLIDNSEKFGSGRPTAVPNTELRMKEDATPDSQIEQTTPPAGGDPVNSERAPDADRTVDTDGNGISDNALKITLEKFGFIDANIGDVLHSIEFTDLDGLNGMLSYVTTDGTVVHIKAGTTAGTVQVKTGAAPWGAEIPAHSVAVSTITGGTFFFTPDDDFNGTSELKFKLHDGSAVTGNKGTGISEEATMSITVDPVNDKPVDVKLTGRNNDGTPSEASDGSTSREDNVQNDKFVLVNGKLVDTKGNEVGVVSVTDVEDAIVSLSASWAALKAEGEKEIDPQQEGETSGQVAERYTGFVNALTNFGKLVTELRSSTSPETGALNALLTDAAALVDAVKGGTTSAELAGSVAQYQAFNGGNSGNGPGLTTKITNLIKILNDAQPFAVSDDRFKVVMENGKWHLRLKDGETLVEGETHNVTLTYTDSGGATTSQSFEIVQGGLHLTPATQGMDDTGARYYSGSDRGALWEDYGTRDGVDANGTAAGTAKMEYTGGEVTPAVPTLVFATISASSDAPIVGVAVDVDGTHPTITLTLKEGTSPDVLKAYLDALFAADDVDPADADAAAINAARVELAKVMSLGTAINFTVTVGDGSSAASLAAAQDNNGITLTLAGERVSDADAGEGTGFNDSTTQPKGVMAARPGRQIETVTIAGGTITPDGGVPITFEGTTLPLFTDANGDGVQADERVATTIYVSRDNNGSWTVKSIATAVIGNAPDHATAPGLAGVTYYVLATVGTNGAVTQNLKANRPAQSWTIGDETAKPDMPLDTDLSDNNPGDVTPGYVVGRTTTWVLVEGEDAAADNSKYSVAGNVLTRTAKTSPDADQAARPSEEVSLTRTTTETRLLQHNFQGFKDVQADGQPATVTENNTDVDNPRDVNTFTFSYSAENGGDADGLASIASSSYVPATAVTIIVVAGGDGVESGAVADTTANTLTVTLKAKASNAEIKAFLEGDTLRDALAELINVTDLTIVHAQGATAIAVDGTTITITIPDLDAPAPQNPGDAPVDPQDIDAGIVGTLNLGNQGLTDLLAARNKDTGTPAKEVITVGNGTIYLPKIEGEALSGARFDFTGMTFEFTDQDSAQNLEAAFTDTNIRAEGDALIAGTDYSALDVNNAGQAAQKGLIDNLITAVRGLGPRGENLQALSDAITAIEATGDGNENAAAARLVVGVEGLITSAKAVAAAAGVGTIEADERQDTTIYVSQDDDGNWTAKSIATADIGNAQDDASNPGLAGVTYYVIATIDAATGTVTMNGHGTASDIDADPNTNLGEDLTYKVVTTATKNFVLKVKNVNDNAPEVDSVAVVGGEAAQKNDDDQWEITLRETVDGAPQDTLTVAASDADNLALDNLRDSNGARSAPDIISYHKAANAADNNNNLVQSVDSASGVITFKDGALDFENVDLRTDAGGKYYLIQVAVKSTSKLSNSGRDERGNDGASDNVHTVTRTIKLYVTQANDAPADFILSDDVPNPLVDQLALKTALVREKEGGLNAAFLSVEGAFDTNFDDYLEGFKNSLNGFGRPEGLRGVDDALIRAARDLVQFLDAVTVPADPAETREAALTRLNEARVTARNSAEGVAKRKVFKDTLKAIEESIKDSLTTKQARLVVEAKWNKDTDGDIVIGTITVADSDIASQGQSHSFTIADNLPGDVANLFQVRTAGGVHTLYFTGTREDLNLLQNYYGKTFNLDITVTDEPVAGTGNTGGKSVTKTVVIAYEAVQITTPSLPADEILGDANHVNVPGVSAATLLSGQTTTVPGAVTQTLGGVNENANGSAAPVVVGEVSLSGMPAGSVKSVEVTNRDGTANNDYEVKWGTVDASGVFTEAGDQNAPAEGAKLYLLFVGENAGNYETPVAVQNGTHLAAELTLTPTIVKTIASSFTGWKDVKADGSGAGAPETFSYTGGAATVTANNVGTPADLTIRDAVSVDISTWTITFNHVEGQEGITHGRTPGQQNAQQVTLSISSTTTVEQVLAYIAENADAGEAFADLVAGQQGDSNLAIVKDLAENVFSPEKTIQVPSLSPASQSVTVADLTIYTSSGEVVTFKGPTEVTAKTPRNENYLFAVKTETGWDLMIGNFFDIPQVGGQPVERYVLAKFGVLGAVGVGQVVPANTVNGTKLTNEALTYEAKQALPFNVPIKNLDDSDPAFPQEETGNPNLAANESTFKKVAADTAITGLLVNDGTITLGTGGNAVNLVVQTVNASVNAPDNASVAFAAAADGNPAVITVTLATDAHTVQDLIDAIAGVDDAAKENFIQAFGLESAPGTALTANQLNAAYMTGLLLGTKADGGVAANLDDVADADTPRLLQAGLHFDNEYARDGSGNKILVFTGGDETAYEPQAEPKAATAATGDLLNSENADGPKYIGVSATGISTGIVIGGASDGDGDGITYRMADAVTGENGNDNNLVTLAIVNGQLTIVWRDGRPDFEAANTGGKKTANSGDYVFVVEAVSNSSLQSDPLDRSARKGKVTTQQTFEFKITDGDEAPWDVEFDSDNTNDTDLTTTTGITSDGTTEIFAAKNDAGDTTTFSVLWARLAGKGMIVGFGDTAPTEGEVRNFDITEDARNDTDDGLLTIDPNNGNPRLKWNTTEVDLVGGTIWYRDSVDKEIKSHTFARGDSVEVLVRASDAAPQGQTGPEAGVPLSSEHLMTIVNGTITVTPDGGQESYSGSELLNENVSGGSAGVALGRLASSEGHSHFVLLKGDGFNIVGGALIYTGGDSGDFEENDTHTLTIVSGRTADAVNAVRHIDFTGQTGVDADGTEGGDTFAYDGTIMGGGLTPTKTVGTSLNSDTTDPSSLTFGVTVSAGNIYYSATADGLYRLQAVRVDHGNVTTTVTTDAIPDTNGPHTYYLVVKKDDGFVAFLPEEPSDNFVLLGTMTVTVTGAGTATATATAEFTANTGVEVTKGDLYAVSDVTHLPNVSIETFEVKLKDVNEAPEPQVDEPDITVPEMAGTAIDQHKTAGRTEQNVETDETTGVKSSSQAGTVLITNAMLRANDEDGDREGKPVPSDELPGNIKYLITGYEDADYHQGSGLPASRETKQGWVEKWDGTTWNRLDPAASDPAGTTGIRRGVDRDGRGGEGTDTFGYDATLLDFSQTPTVTSTVAGGDLAVNVEIKAGNVYPDDNINTPTAFEKHTVTDLVSTPVLKRLNDQYVNDAQSGSVSYSLYADTEKKTLVIVTNAPKPTQFKLGTITVTRDGSGWTVVLTRQDTGDIPLDSGDGNNFFTQADVDAGHVRFVHSGDDRDVDPTKEGIQARFKYRLQDTRDDKAEQKTGAEREVDITVTNINDRPFVDDAAEAVDGNAAVKDADAAARTFNENVPQTAVNINADNTSTQGGITLTNAMFGIVDVDTADADVKIWLDMSRLDTRQLFKIGGTATDLVDREQDTGLPSANENLEPHDGTAIGRILVKVGTAGTAADWVVLGQQLSSLSSLSAPMQTLFENNVLTHFTLKQLKDGHVVFLHEISDEQASVTLTLAKISDGSLEQVFTRPADNAAQPTKDKFSEQAEVQLLVTQDNDAPVEVVSKVIFDEGAIHVLTLNDLHFRDYDDETNAVTFTVTNLAGLTRDGSLQARLEKFNQTTGQWQTVTTDAAGGSPNTFTMADVASGDVRIVHLGQHPVTSTTDADNKSRLKFDFTVDDDADGSVGNTDTDPVAGTFDITITPKNDVPTDIIFFDHARMTASESRGQVRVGRVDSSLEADAKLFVIEITDEEASLITSNPAAAGDGQGHYRYVFDTTEGSLDAWRWLEIVTETIGDKTRHVIKFKSVAGLHLQARKEAYAEHMGLNAVDVTDATINNIMANGGIATNAAGEAQNLTDIRPLTPKANGENYSFRLIATDAPNVKNGDDATQAYSEDFIIPVRDFDFDWNLTNNDGPDGVVIDDTKQTTYFTDDYDKSPNPATMLDGRPLLDAEDSFVFNAVRNGVNVSVTIRVLKDVLERDDEYVTVDRDVITLHVHRAATSSDMMDVLLSGAVAAMDDAVTDGRATANDKKAIATLLGDNVADDAAVPGNNDLMTGFALMVNAVDEQSVGSFTIFPSLDYVVSANDGWTFSVGDVQDTEFGTIRIENGGARNVFNVHFAPKPDQPDLIRLKEG